MLNLDTHIFIHALNDSLTKKELKCLSNDNWSISAIVLWELHKLRQLKKIELDIEDPEFTIILSKIHVWELNVTVFRAFRLLDFRNDPADEIIAATSLAYNVPLVTRDQKILKSKVVPFAIL